MSDKWHDISEGCGCLALVAGFVVLALAFMFHSPIAEWIGRQ
jgi:hypothetical protein